MVSPIHELTQAGLEYWQSLALGDELPRRRQVEPWDIPMLLPYVNLVGVFRQESGPVRLRHLLEGSEIVERFKRSSTGKWFDENYTAEHLQNQLPAYLETIEKRVPTCGQISLVKNGIEHLRYERLITPLRGEADDVDVLFIVFGFFQLSKSEGDETPEMLPLHTVWT